VHDSPEARAAHAAREAELAAEHGVRFVRVRAELVEREVRAAVAVIRAALWSAIDVRELAIDGREHEDRREQVLSHDLLTLRAVRLPRLLRKHVGKGRALARATTRVYLSHLTRITPGLEWWSWVVAQRGAAGWW
jgi:hypothetical protein